MSKISDEILNEIYDLCSRKSQIEKIEENFKDVIEYYLEHQDVNSK
ncbi:10113_t:CDS:1, partial [Cetraspora pellucida]